MAKRLQIRGGTSEQHSTFTGATREITIDTSKNTVVVHDGSTVGGFALATTAYADRASLPINSLRADRYLVLQDIANMVYTSGDLTKIQYNNATDVDYEVFTYSGGDLSGIAHYVGGILKGNSVLLYTDDYLSSVIFTGV